MFVLKRQPGESWGDMLRRASSREGKDPAPAYAAVQRELDGAEIRLESVVSATTYIAALERIRRLEEFVGRLGRYSKGGEEYDDSEFLDMLIDRARDFDRRPNGIIIRSGAESRRRTDQHYGQWRDDHDSTLGIVARIVARGDGGSETRARRSGSHSKHWSDRVHVPRHPARNR